MNGLLKRTFSVSFYPTGTVIRFSSNSISRDPVSNCIPLDELWEHYLKPAISGEGTFIKNKGLNPINALMIQLCAHPFLNMANYLKMRGNLQEWDSSYEKALDLIQDPKWAAETAEGKAEGDLILGDKTVVLADYLYSFQQYQRASMPAQAEQMWQKAFSMRPK